MNKGLARTILVLAILSNCGKGFSGPVDPSDPPPDPPDFVVDFPGAQVDGKTVTIFEGDSLGCSISLSPPNDDIVVGWDYDGGDVMCSSSYGPLGSPKKMMYLVAREPLIPSVGEHRLDFFLQSHGGAILQTITYTLVVLPRPSGSVGQRIR